MLTAVPADRADQAVRALADTIAAL
jgi:hypothetical protein